MALMAAPPGCARAAWHVLALATTAGLDFVRPARQPAHTRVVGSRRVAVRRVHTQVTEVLRLEPLADPRPRRTRHPHRAGQRLSGAHAGRPPLGPACGPTEVVVALMAAPPGGEVQLVQRLTSNQLVPVLIPTPGGARHRPPNRLTGHLEPSVSDSNVVHGNRSTPARHQSPHCDSESCRCHQARRRTCRGRPGHPDGPVSPPPAPSHLPTEPGRTAHMDGHRRSTTSSTLPIPSRLNRDPRSPGRVGLLA